MLEIVTAYIEQHHLLPERGKVIVAVSGGADSLCLLHLLNRLCGAGRRYPAIQLHVAHLNHQLRGATGAQEAEAVAHLATSWGLPVTVGSIDVPALARQERRSLEDAARTARYRFLREVAAGRPIAVAHQRDDQVETLLLHWLRGGGITSMLGLQPRQQDIIRPLLYVSHADTVAYCQQHGLVPLEDLSNVDPRFLRNRIRHELLPLLETMNPAVRETLLRNAEILSVDAAWIEEQLDQHWPSVVLAEHEQQVQFSLRALLALHLSLQRHLLRRAAEHLCRGQSPLELRHYRLLEQLVQRPATGEELMLHLPQRLRARRRADLLMLEQMSELPEQTYAYPTTPTTGNTEVPLSIPGQVPVPGTGWIASASIVEGDTLNAAVQALRQEQWDALWRILPRDRYTVYVDGDRIGDQLSVRTRRAGDRIQPLGMAHEKKVQDVLVDSHIPRAEREHIPLFFSSQHCVWLAGVHLDERVRLTGQTRRIVSLSIHTE
ncbi:MAG: tRNA lysidine(34) synthetase TilS [Ktedonobacteraceae bacterium]|nr:tRNA lysidine(34) synthetase TilS [Ktedonobacteraceae bacterium]